MRCAVGERCRVAGGHRGRRPVAEALAEHRLQAGQGLHVGVGAQVLVAGQPEVGRHQVVEEPAVVGGGEVAVARDRQLVLRLPADLPLPGGDRRVLAHREPGAGLGVVRRVRLELSRPQPPERGQAALEVARGVEVEQHPPQVLVDRDRRVAGGVDAAGDAGVDLAQGDLVGDEDRGLQPGAAGLLHVVRRGRRRQSTAEDALPGQVVVAAVLEHRTRRHLADLLALQAEPGDQAVQRGGQHVLVGRLAVGAVGPGEGDPVSPDDCGAPDGECHGGNVLPGWAGQLD